MRERLRRARRVLEEAEASQTSVAPRAERSLARDAVLAVLEPDTGRLRIDNSFDLVVAGAVLVELVHVGRLEVSGTGRTMGVTVRDPAPLGDPELDDALLTIATGVLGSRVRRLLPFLSQPSQLVSRLVSAGVLVEESHRRLAMFTVRRYRPTPAAGHDELLAALRSALLGESIPDERTALLVSLLAAGGKVHHLVPQRSSREARRRAAGVLERVGEDERLLVSEIAAAVTRANSD